MNDKDLYWQNNKTPASRRYDDIYFSAEDGCQESRHVFLEGINAPEIWQGKDHFTLLENGFGTGLNFLLTCKAWLKTAKPGSRLTYIATEKHPLSRQDMALALACWPELEPLAQELIKIYPPNVPGFHQHDLKDGRIKLLLLFGDSGDCLSRLAAEVDAIYLDGFAPSRNPDMWTEKIFCELARLSKPSAALATFTAAGFVRRGLEAAGFHMKKSKGFGKKRENLTGLFAGKARPSPFPWYQPPTPLPTGSRIAILGGGIAGLTMGLALVQRGYQVQIFELDSQLMNRASGNPYAILDPYLTTGPSGEGDFYRAALLHALAFYNNLDPDIFVTRGLMKYPEDKTEQEKFLPFTEQAQLPPEIMEYTEDGALFFPTCGAISTALIRKKLSESLSIIREVRITRLQKGPRWTLLTDKENTPYSADAVVICGGAATTALDPVSSLPLDPVRGQITYLSVKEGDAPFPNVLCGKGYLIPPQSVDQKMTMICGATFQRKDNDIILRDEDHRENIQQAAKLWPNIMKNAEITGGRAALRAYSPDHLPICGPVPDFSAYEEAYSTLKHGPRHQEFAPAPYQENLFVLSGLGARGFLTAPLLADILAAQIAGEPLPLPREICHSLHPGRFLIRNLKRG